VWRAAQQAIVIAVKGPRLANVTCRNVAASLPPELHDNEGLYKKMKRLNVE
jgi:hypothetical protein